VDIALLLLGLPICVADCRSFVIANIYTKILFVVAIAHLSIFGFGDLWWVAISTAILASLLFCKTGMGDIKLMGLILISHSFNAFDYLGHVFLLAMVHIVVCAGINRKIPLKIPLAPSILIGLSTHLATR
jgi:hypothetical protein